MWYCTTVLPSKPPLLLSIEQHEREKTMNFDAHTFAFTDVCRLVKIKICLLEWIPFCCWISVLLAVYLEFCMTLAERHPHQTFKMLLNFVLNMISIENLLIHQTMNHSNGFSRLYWYQCILEYILSDLLICGLIFCKMSAQL